MRQKRSLVEDLIALGMPSAFGSADFTGISAAGNLAVTDVVHEAYVAIDEEGTFAAAATAAPVAADWRAPAPAAPASATRWWKRSCLSGSKKPAWK